METPGNLSDTRPLRPGVPSRILLGLIWAYRRTLASVMPSRCRFYPSCSAYAARAIELHGAGKGSWLAVRRVLRCHPFHPGGYDPPPARGDR